MNDEMNEMILPVCRQFKKLHFFDQNNFFSLKKNCNCLNCLHTARTIYFT